MMLMMMTKSTVDFVAHLSPPVAGLSKVNKPAKVEHVQLGRLCRKWVIFVARMSNVLSTLSPVCTGL